MHELGHHGSLPAARTGQVGPWPEHHQTRRRLKQAIPVRTFTNWGEEQPSFLEIDLVAHCGETTEDQYLNTLTCTDLCSGWTEPVAPQRHTQEPVRDALQAMPRGLPFPLFGINSDNGSEFINDLLCRDGLQNQITFTRSRPYQKNNQAHVEPRVLRSSEKELVGRASYRLQTQEECAWLQSGYANLRLYINFFQPVLKLIAKEHIGKQLVRMYDLARTPYQPILEPKEIALDLKAHLTHLYVQLNPVPLRTSIMENLNVTFLFDATKPSK